MAYGMLRTVIITTLLLILMLYATSTIASTDEGAPSSAVQDEYGMLYPETRSNNGNNMLEMARLYELMQLAAMQGRQNAKEEEMEAELLPIPERLMDNEEFGKDKRGSYMSLCHFKICNMGRKRTWNPWSRA